MSIPRRNPGSRIISGSMWVFRNEIDYQIHFVRIMFKRFQNIMRMILLFMVSFSSKIHFIAWPINYLSVLKCIWNLGEEYLNFILIKRHTYCMTSKIGFSSKQNYHYFLLYLLCFRIIFVKQRSIKNMILSIACK